ncbi:MAG: DUF1801 domain-containing protein [Candidatus Lokiarchaeota archaeon]|nr:DUF1801 domain-containing protein [Candidatus Lokiarchaeota archaeon]
MTELKTKPTKKNVDEFLKKVENATKREDSFKILKLMEKVTNEKPVMWGDSIVGFGSYHYKYASGREGDWPLVGFSPRKQNLTLYIMSGFEGYDEILSKLGKFKIGKSCLYINKLKDIDIDNLKELVSESVKYMKRQYQ